MSAPSDCLFCAIVAGRIPAARVFERDDVIGFEDIHPQAPVHVLFIPRKHIANANALTDEDAGLVAQLMLAARDYAQEVGIADAGYRLVMNCNPHGGQTVYHIHLHLLGGAQLPGGFGV